MVAMENGVSICRTGSGCEGVLCVCHQQLPRVAPASCNVLRMLTHTNRSHVSPRSDESHNGVKRFEQQGYCSNTLLCSHGARQLSFKLCVGQCVRLACLQATSSLVETTFPPPADSIMGDGGVISHCQAWKGGQTCAFCPSPCVGIVPRSDTVCDQCAGLLLCEQCAPRIEV